MLLCQLHRRKGRNSSGRKRQKQRSNGGRRPGKGISNSIGRARCMLHSEGEFRKEGQLTLLTSRLRRRKAMESSYQRFVVGKKKERTTFQVRPEVKNSRVGCLKFTVECRITLLRRRKFGREEGQRLPVVGDKLLKNTANMRIRSISGQRKRSSGMRMGEKSGMGEGLLSLAESLGHRRSPGERFWSTDESIGEGVENSGGMGNKTVVEINEAKKTLKILDRSGLRIVENGLDMRGERGEASSCDMVAEEINRRLGKRTLFGVNKDAIVSKNGEELAKMLEML